MRCSSGTSARSRFDGSGSQLAPPVALARFDPPAPPSHDGAARGLALAVVPGGVRVVWSVIRGLESDVFTVATDLDGRITQPVAQLADPRTCAGCGLALAYVRGVLFFAWVEDVDPALGASGRRRLRVGTLDGDGAPRGAAVEVVGDARSVADPVLVATSAGVLVGYHAWDDTGVGVSVALVSCDR
jgi:hypothetical protein